MVTCVSWDVQWSHEKTKNYAKFEETNYAKFEETNEDYYGIFRNGLFLTFEEGSK